MTEYDAVVIGAGYAGVTAARDLRKEDKSVLVLEARDRIGGRTHNRPFKGHDGVQIEAGGAYVEPHLQPNMRREIERYSIPLKALDGAIENLCFINGGERRTGLMLPVAELGAFEQAVVLTAKAAERLNTGLPLAAQSLADLDVSIDDFYAPLNLPTATHEFIKGLIGGYCAADPDQISMLHMLAWTAGCGGSPYGCFFAVFETKFENGTGDLIKAICDDADADLSLETPVERVSQDASGVRVRTADGAEYAAKACIVAVPSNTFGSIDFAPALSEAKAAAVARRHHSQGVKRFFIVENAPSGFMGMAGYGDTASPRMQWLFEDDKLADGNTLMIGFSSDPTFCTPDLDQAQAAVAEFIPDAKVIASDLNDWSNDPYSQGVVAIAPPGTMMTFAKTMNEPEGRVFFAGSDIAESPFGGGWMEGAVDSGHWAAHRAGLVIGD